jgi:hypothetical protein
MPLISRCLDLERGRRTTKAKDEEEEAGREREE